MHSWIAKTTIWTCTKAHVHTPTSTDIRQLCKCCWLSKAFTPLQPWQRNYQGLMRKGCYQIFYNWETVKYSLAREQDFYSMFHVTKILLHTMLKNVWSAVLGWKQTEVTQIVPDQTTCTSALLWDVWKAIPPWHYRYRLRTNTQK
jgi:hypothetical protein